MKMKRILDVMKVISLIVNIVEVTEYLRHVFTLGDYVWKKTKRRPMILPIIMEA